MLAYRALQLAKNGLYRVTGEAVSGVAGRDDGADRTLRVLMYHKVNDLSPNPITVPTAVFAQQMELLGELGYVVVSLDDVLDHYLEGTPLSERAVLITFDDGYRDNLENALPILQRHRYPAVLFVPIGFLESDRPLPHEEALRVLGVVKSWAPARSCGLVFRMDRTGRVVESAHARVDSNRHGVTGVAARGGQVIAAARGHRNLLKLQAHNR